MMESVASIKNAKIVEQIIKRQKAKIIGLSFMNAVSRYIVL